MKFLTEEQKYWLTERKVKVDGMYMFPRTAFSVFEIPNKNCGEIVSVDMFNNITSDFFLVKSKVNGFLCGNFYKKPYKKDFYLLEDDISFRSNFEYFFLYAICFIPMSIWNLFRLILKK